MATLANQTALAIENARLVTNAAIVREMHHRIKNNLQTVAMLMQLQLPDAEQLGYAAGAANQHPPRAKHCHRARGAVGAGVYPGRRHRCAAAHHAHDGRNDRCDRTANYPKRTGGSSFTLPSRSATAVALAVNELVQNALEHAFVGRKQGRVTVSLGRGPEDMDYPGAG